MWCDVSVILLKVIPFSVIVHDCAKRCNKAKSLIVCRYDCQVVFSSGMKSCQMATECLVWSYLSHSHPNVRCGTACVQSSGTMYQRNCRLVLWVMVQLVSYWLQFVMHCIVIQPEDSDYNKNPGGLICQSCLELIFQVLILFNETTWEMLLLGRKLVICSE